MFDDAPPSAGEVRALAHQLMSWADHLTAQVRSGPGTGREMTEEERHDLILGLAAAAREARRLRAAIFSGIAIGDPNWDVLLDLFIQEMNGFRTSLDHLALTGDLPAATVYQCVDALAGLELLERTPDRFDSRVVWLSLSAKGHQGMFDLIEQAAAFVRPVAGQVPERGRAEL